MPSNPPVAPVRRPAFTKAQLCGMLTVSESHLDKILKELGVETVHIGRRVVIPRAEVQKHWPFLTDDVLDAAFPT